MLADGLAKRPNRDGTALVIYDFEGSLVTNDALAHELPSAADWLGLCNGSIGET
jgi:hypothetical protein